MAKAHKIMNFFLAYAFFGSKAGLGQVGFLQTAY